MLKNLILACLVIVFAVVLTAGLNNYFKSQRGDFFVLDQGQIVPDFKFNGQSLYNFKGKHVIVHFWASWCAPCVVEFPELIGLANKRDDVIILAFSSDKNQDTIDRFLTRNDFKIPDNFKIFLDKDRRVTEDKFSVFRLPESFILNRDMILQNHIVGAYKDWVDLDI